MKTDIGKIKKQKYYLLVLSFYLIYLFIFAYYPMYGMLLAFKEYSYKIGILGSPWAGLKYFKMFFSSPDFTMVLRNTLGMSVLDILIGFPAPIIFALLLNEIHNIKFKRIVQSVSYLPHFISWVVVAGIFMSIFSLDGIVNEVLLALGLISKPTNILGNKDIFWFIITFLNIWKEIGWNSIIYLSAITSIDPQMYEAAMIEGANEFQKVMKITLPSLMPTIVMLFIFRLGYILNVGFEQQLFLQNPLNYKMAEVIDTYVFKMGLQKYMFSYATAVSVFKGFTGLVLVVASNKIVRKISGSGIF